MSHVSRHVDITVISAAPTTDVITINCFITNNNGNFTFESSVVTLIDP